MKKTKIILVAALGICMLSFMPTVLGKADVRPIEDYTATNDYVAAYVDPESNLIVFPHGFFVLPGLEVIANCEHHGSVLEKDLKDGRILYKINLHVKGAMMFIAYYEDRLIFVGEMDYYFAATEILYEGEIGGPIPNILHIWFPEWFGIEEPIGESVSSHFTASGTGAFVDDAAAIEQGFAPGATAKVKINQVGLFGAEFWPVEFVFFH